MPSGIVHIDNEKGLTACRFDIRGRSIDVGVSVAAEGSKVALPVHRIAARCHPLGGGRTFISRHRITCGAITRSAVAVGVLAS